MSSSPVASTSGDTHKEKKNRNKRRREEAPAEQQAAVKKTKKSKAAVEAVAVEVDDAAAQRKEKKRRKKEFKQQQSVQAQDNIPIDPVLIAQGLPPQHAGPDTSSVAGSHVSASNNAATPLELPSSLTHALGNIDGVDMTRFAAVLRTLGESSPGNVQLSVIPNNNPEPPSSPPPLEPPTALPGQGDHAFLLANRWYNSKQLNELVNSIGLVYKKGKFSAAEEEMIDNAIENYRLLRRISKDELQTVIFPKNKNMRDNAFWHEITMAVPQRPVNAVYHHVRRTHHPMKLQGKWTPEEDAALKQAVSSHGQQWEKISTIVGRMSTDCRDRYRNHLVNCDARVYGAWSKEEEDRLTQVVTQMTVMQGKNMDNDVFWSKVTKEMGGTRTRQQCRIKWQDELSGVVKNDGVKARWSNHDAWILVQKISGLNVRHDSEIDWKSISDPSWNLWSAHVLQKRWLTMKRGVKGHEDMPFNEIVEILKQKKTYADPTPANASQGGRKKSAMEVDSDDEPFAGPSRLRLRSMGAS